MDSSAIVQRNSDSCDVENIISKVRRKRLSMISSQQTYEITHTIFTAVRAQGR